jgi:hypothetical protein
MAFFPVPTGRVIFEIRGAPVREELARDGRAALLPCRISANCPCNPGQAGNKLLTTVGFIVHRPQDTTSARNSLLTAEVKDRLESPSTSTPP